MSFLGKIGDKISRGISEIEERNRRHAKLNRIRAALKQEERAAQLEYTALGRYYYANLRDPARDVAEEHCRELDRIETRLNAAIAQLEKYYAELAETRASRNVEIDVEDAECVDPQTAAEMVKNAAVQVGEKVKDVVYDVKDAAKEAAEEVGDQVLHAVAATAKTVSEKADNVAKAAEECILDDDSEKAENPYSGLKNDSNESEAAVSSAVAEPEAEVNIDAEEPEYAAADPDENDSLPFAD